MYIDILLLRLRKTGVGCYINNIFTGAFGYADDITLLTPTKASLKIFLKVCSKFSHEYDVVFNPDKSVLIVFGSDDDDSIYFDNVLINTNHFGISLGHIGSNSVNRNIKKCKNEMIIKTNVIMNKFGHSSAFTKLLLFKHFLHSLLWFKFMGFSKCYFK